MKVVAVFDARVVSSENLQSKVNLRATAAPSYGLNNYINQHQFYVSGNRVEVCAITEGLVVQWHVGRREFSSRSAHTFAFVLVRTECAKSDRGRQIGSGDVATDHSENEG